MSAAPSFSSFPNLPAESRRDEPVAGPSREAPSFGSFPELQSTKKVRRSREASHDRDRDRDFRQSRRRERDDEGVRDDRHDQKRNDDKHRSDKDGRSREEDRRNNERRRRDHERERSRDRSRIKDKEEDDHRHRERKKERDRKRDRSQSAERRYKDERRKRDREQAERLIRGEVNKGKSTDHRVGDNMGEGSRAGGGDKWAKAEDGVPWYEASNKVGKNGYEELFDPTSSKAFFPDTAGDRDLQRYASAASTSAPRYRRDGKNRILGLPDILRLVYSRERTQKGVEVAPMGKPYIPRYSARPLESSAGRHLRRILLQPSDSQSSFDPHSDVIAFDMRPPRGDSDGPAYRSITHQPDEEEEELAAFRAAVGNYSTLEEEVRRRTAEQEKHLRDHPDDVESWIDYSRLHLRLAPENERTMGSSDPAQLPTTRARAEVTLSILSRALEAHEANMYSTQLHIAYLKAAEQFWPPEKVTGRWKNVIRELTARDDTSKVKVDEESMMDVWLGYIAWREGQGFGKDDAAGGDGGGQGGAGGVDEVVDVYIECLEKLRSGITGENQQAREENLVYLFLRACLFLKQAGYEERALAAFQALMEITFFKPDHLRYQPDPSTRDAWFEGVLSEFEGFWDDELPRLGETAARGWRDSSSTENLQPAAQPLIHAALDPFERWLEAEKHADVVYRRPGRATDLDDATEDDPFHIVLFSDIQPFLFPIFTPEVRLQLIYAFLTFLGLPFTPPDIPSTSAGGNDPHLRWTLAYNETLRQAFWPRREGVRRLPWQTVGGEPMEPERARGLEHPFECPVKCWSQDRGTMFAKHSAWFRDMAASDLGSVDVDFVRNAFTLLRPLVPDPAFTLASFAFEAAVSPKGAVKLAKTILANDRDNLLLWEGYARLERQRGNLTAARTVYVTALQAAAAVRAAETRSKSADELDLWAGWAEMEYFEAGNEERCLQVLLLAAGVGGEHLADHANPNHSAKAPSSISMLKARQHYSSFSSPYDTSQLLLVSLFTYLSNNITAARSLIIDHTNRVPPSSAAAEEALQLLTKLLYAHTTRHASPASLSRDVLEQALTSFPNNTNFLSLYLYGELGGRVYGRVQRLIATITSIKSGQHESAGVVGYLWSIWAEGVSAHRTFWDHGGGGAERVRAVLDRAVNSISGRSSAPLWMLYIEFETLMARYTTAKQLCYRAVSALGGCKRMSPSVLRILNSEVKADKCMNALRGIALYLLPFTPALRPHFTPRELKDWAELILERGIRIRIPFDLFWSNDDEEGEAAVVLPEDEEVEEDELAFLSERQALKPY